MDEKIKKIEELLVKYEGTKNSLSKDSVHSQEAWVRVKYYMGLCSGLEKALGILKEGK